MNWHLYPLNNGILGILYFTASRLIFIFYGKVFTNTVVSSYQSSARLIQSARAMLLST